jgi:hypothetical protein
MIRDQQALCHELEAAHPRFRVASDSIHGGRAIVVSALGEEKPCAPSLTSQASLAPSWPS